MADQSIAVQAQATYELIVVLRWARRQTLRRAGMSAMHSAYRSRMIARRRRG